MIKLLKNINKSLREIILIILFLTYFYSFPHNINSKDSIKALKDTINIEYEEIEINCMEYRKSLRIINDEEEYKNAFYTEPHPYFHCESYNHPKINFNKYTLIFYLTTCGGCDEPEINKKIIKIRNTNEYILIIKIKQFGNCKIARHISFWLLIPKIKGEFNFHSKEKIQYVKEKENKH
jgi:hypothetical protein